MITVRWKSEQIDRIRSNTYRIDWRNKSLVSSHQKIMYEYTSRLRPGIIKSRQYRGIKSQCNYLLVCSHDP